MRGEMRGHYIGEIAIFAAKAQSLFIPQTSLSKCIAIPAGGEMIGTQVHMGEILILRGHFLSNFLNSNMMFPVWPY